MQTRPFVAISRSLAFDLQLRREVEKLQASAEQLRAREDTAGSAALQAELQRKADLVEAAYVKLEQARKQNDELRQQFVSTGDERSKTNGPEVNGPHREKERVNEFVLLLSPVLSASSSEPFLLNLFLCVFAFGF